MKSIIKRIAIAIVCIFIIDLSFSYAQGKKRTGKNSGNIVVATWNIGHFSKGQKDFSFITSSDLTQRAKEYRIYIDSLKADVICINEYEREFCSDSINNIHAITENLLFDNYRYRQLFAKNRFVCNAVFSNRKLKNVIKYPFIYNMFAKEERPAIEWHYFVVADIKIQGEIVKLICTHLVPYAEKHCQNQIKELLYYAEKYPKVIICGDINTWDFSKFKKAGYTMANDGSLVTFPSKSYAIDNIFVKGLNISDIRVIKTELSDHYSLSCRVSL